MKKKIKIKKLMLFGILFIFVICLFGYIVYGEINFIKRYDDINLYKNDNYLTLSTSNAYSFSSKNCYKYFPKYDDFIKKDNINKFYVFDGSETLGRTAVSFVLEIKFINLFDYNEYVSYVLNRCAYTDKFNINYKNYECLVTTNKEFTKFYYKDVRPYAFGMFCMNEDKLIIRYIYYRDIEIAIDEKFKNVFKNTNCEW